MCNKLRESNRCQEADKGDNTLAIIPVRNEEATIAQVVHSLQESGINSIRIIDNGSRDGSAARAREAGAEVLWEPIPGYGCACWRGLQQLPPEIEWILFCDGDGSDDLRHIAEFLAQREEYDFILGDRTATVLGRQVLTPVQHFGNRFATWLIKLGWGYRYRDLGPLRLIRRSSLEQMQMQDRDFGWTLEMQVKAVENHLRICEIPVNYRPRQGGKSKISGNITGSIKAGTVILMTLGKLYWQTLQLSGSLALTIGFFNS
jgi:glycosyltransferase involved in cell wall biosynthesis